MAIRIQVVNYSHLFPTRYALELEGLKGSVSADTFKEPSQREDAKKLVKKQLEERYAQGKNKWFFQALRVRNTAISCCRCTETPPKYSSKYHSTLRGPVASRVTLRARCHHACFLYHVPPSSLYALINIWETYVMYDMLGECENASYSGLHISRTRIKRICPIACIHRLR